MLLSPCLFIYSPHKYPSLYQAAPNTSLKKAVIIVVRVNRMDRRVQRSHHHRHHHVILQQVPRHFQSEFSRKSFSSPPFNSQYLLVYLRFSSSCFTSSEGEYGVHVNWRRSVRPIRRGGAGRSTVLLSMVSAYIFMLYSWRWLTCEVFTTSHMRA
jgi:hypothetical protein